MMKNRLSFKRAASLSVLSAGLAAGARAEDAYQANAQSGSFEVCRLGADGGGCAHFQGYVYVHRDPSAPRALAADSKTSPASDASLGGGRLYIRVDGADTP
jgi:hypothetical protein